MSNQTQNIKLDFTKRGSFKSNIDSSISEIQNISDLHSVNYENKLSEDYEKKNNTVIYKVIFEYLYFWQFLF